MSELIFRLIFYILFSGFNISKLLLSNDPVHMTLVDLPSDAIFIISSYLENPFNTLGSLNKHFNELFSTRLSAELIFKGRFNIPELIEDDIDNNERELKYIISSFSKFHNPNHIYQALRNAFLYGNKFDVLIPKLMKYFDRIDPKRYKSEELKKLFHLKKFDYLFQQVPKSFKQVYNSAKFRDVQEYISANPDLLDHYNAEIASNLPSYKINEWINSALLTNMPNVILKARPHYRPEVFDSPHCIWSESSIPIDQYPEMFEKINFIIDNMSLSNNEGSSSSDHSSSTSDDDSGSENGNDGDNGSRNENYNDNDSVSSSSNESDNGNGGSTSSGNLNDNFNDSDSSASSVSSGSSSSSGEDDIEVTREHYRILNHIRFGPEDSNIFDEKIKNKTIPIELKFLMCKSAFLTNKMDLYFKLLPEITPKLAHYGHVLYDHFLWFQPQIDDPFNVHKFYFRVHEFASQYFSQTLHNSPLFLELASKYYRVIYCKLNGLTFESVLKILPDYIGSGFPESITIYRKYDDIYDLKRFVFKEMIFDNAESLEKLIVNIEQEFFYYSIEINVENLRLLIESESIQLFMRQKRLSFLISTYSLYEVLEMPITNSLANIVRVEEVYDFYSIPLYDLKTTEQLSRLEILLGKSVSTLLKPEHDYFKYRHVFKYLIESGKQLPVNLSKKTRTLVKIDFPSVEF